MELAEQVHQFLVQVDPRLGRINVEAEDSTVTLLGTVDSYYLRSLAVATAKRVAGVEAVADELTV